MTRRARLIYRASAVREAVTVDHHLASPGAEGERWNLLRQLLADECLLHGTPSEPITDRRGRATPWTLYSWHVTTTSAGAEIAGRCLLDRLPKFDSTQLVSCGFAGTPLVSACVLLGGGRYTGLYLRDAKKSYGSNRLVEGRPDRSRPVVVVDDSLSSGTSLRRSIEALEGDGFTVEGAIGLVHFPDRGGAEWARARGYRIETLFDAWDDLRLPRPEPPPAWRRALDAVEWADETLPAGLDPATAARRVAERYLDDGRALRPPEALDDVYDGRGGVFVSLRDRDTDLRLARDGFWHFDPADSDPPRDMVLAAIKTVDSAGPLLTRRDLDSLKLAATFFTPLELIPPRELDFARYGVVVRSRAWDVKQGGALPNTQVFTSAQEQYAHARRNARLGPYEPHDLFRHEIRKVVEPGCTWPAYGTPDDPVATAWTRSQEVGRALTARARAVLDGDPGPTPVPGDLVPVDLRGVAVSLYREGTLGSSVAWGDSLDGCLEAAAGAAWEKSPTGDPGAVAILVTLLYDPEWHGRTSKSYAAAKLRLGLDALAVWKGDRRALVLPDLVIRNGWSKHDFATHAMTEAGIVSGPCDWATYRTVAWLDDGAAKPVRVSRGFPVREVADAPATVEDRIDELAGYVARHLDGDGVPLYAYRPLDGTRVEEGTVARMAHALQLLVVAGELRGRPDWCDLGRRGVRHFLDHVEAGDGVSVPDQHGGPMANAQLLAAVAASGDEALVGQAAVALAPAVLWTVQEGGQVVAPASVPKSHTDQDFLPGAVALALARYARVAGPEWGAGRLATIVEWYMRRFRLVHSWGLVGWLPQACATAHDLAPDPAFAAAAFELVDWALERQTADGAFLTDLDPSGPGVLTAFVCEGVAGAWSLAQAAGDTARASRYASAWEAGMGLVDRLTVRPRDCFWFHEPAAALGGVRGNFVSSELRIDNTSHALNALCRGLMCQRTAGQPAEEVG